jgi:Flp pilus assembly protein TadD
MTNATQASQDAPGIFHVQAIAGQAMLAGKKYNEALGHLDRAGTLMPNQPPIELMRGFSLEKLGRKNDAAEAYRHVLNLSPDGPEAKRAHEGLARMGMRAQ